MRTMKVAAITTTMGLRTVAQASPGPSNKAPRDATFDKHPSAPQALPNPRPPLQQSSGGGFMTGGHAAAPESVTNLADKFLRVSVNGAQATFLDHLKRYTEPLWGNLATRLSQPPRAPGLFIDHEQGGAKEATLTLAQDKALRDAVRRAGNLIHKRVDFAAVGESVGELVADCIALGKVEVSASVSRDWNDEDTTRLQLSSILTATMVQRLEDLVEYHGELQRIKAGTMGVEEAADHLALTSRDWDFYLRTKDASAALVSVFSYVKVVDPQHLPLDQTPVTYKIRERYHEFILSSEENRCLQGLFDSIQELNKKKREDLVTCAPLFEQAANNARQVQQIDRSASYGHDGWKGSGSSHINLAPYMPQSAIDAFAELAAEARDAATMNTY